MGALTTTNIPSQVQQQLTSVSDDASNGFHSVLATCSATDKLKAMSGTSGIGMASVFNSLSVYADPCNFKVVNNFQDATTAVGMGEYYGVGPVHVQTGRLVRIQYGVSKR